MKEMEERLESKLSLHLDAKFMELAASLQHTFQESSKELSKNHPDAGQLYHSIRGDNRGEGPINSHYSCGTRLARIDFLRFNSENVNQWVYQCENYFLIDNTPEDVKVRLEVVHLEGKTLQ
jgi:hypothetical protein